MMKSNYNRNTQWHSLIDIWFAPWSGLNNLKCHILQGPVSCKFYRCFGFSSFGFGRTKPGVLLLERWCGRGLDGICPAFMPCTLQSRRPLVVAFNNTYDLIRFLDFKITMIHRTKKSLNQPDFKDDISSFYIFCILYTVSILLQNEKK